MATQTAVLTEIERQREYLERLPEDFPFSLFDYKVALESQRKSAYKTTAAAAREIVDNAIEAGADHVEIIFRQGRSQSGQKFVNAVAFIDDGPGMLPEMIRYALCWGGGTHYDHPDHIGRFGFGLPNSSINQTRLVEVYSRTAADKPIYKSWLNIDDFVDRGSNSVPRPTESELPSFVKQHLTRNHGKFDHGVIVVWLAPDHLTYKRPARLKEHLIDDFGVVYRYFLLKADKPLELTVEGVKVLPVHPLFLEPGARYYEPPAPDVESPTGGGARQVNEWHLPVRYWEDRDTGERHLGSVESEEAIHSADKTLGLGTIYLRIARLPVRFAQGERQHKGTDSYRRYEIRKSRRGISFVRADREIETLDVFPKSAEDSAQGLGDWPLLQTFAYHWGIEVKFSPALDDVFGITNDKQGVRPIEDFWRLLAAEKIDAEAHRENRWQERKRKELKSETAKQKEESRDPSFPSPAEASMQDADVGASDRPDIPDQHKGSAKRNFESRVEERSRITGEAIEEARAGLDQSFKNRKYSIELFESPHGPFYEPQWVGGVISVRINTNHPFYRVLYECLLEMSGGEQAKEAIDVLLLTLGRAELTSGDADMAEWYRTQRERRWSPYLEDALRVLTRRIAEKQEEEELAGV